MMIKRFTARALDLYLFKIGHGQLTTAVVTSNIFHRAQTFFILLTCAYSRESGRPWSVCSLVLLIDVGSGVTAPLSSPLLLLNWCGGPVIRCIVVAVRAIAVVHRPWRVVGAAVTQAAIGVPVTVPLIATYAVPANLCTTVV